MATVDVRQLDITETNVAIRELIEVTENPASPVPAGSLQSPPQPRARGTRRGDLHAGDDGRTPRLPFQHGRAAADGPRRPRAGQPLLSLLGGDEPVGLLQRDGDRGRRRLDGRQHDARLSADARCHARRERRRGRGGPRCTSSGAGWRSSGPTTSAGACVGENVWEYDEIRPRPDRARTRRGADHSSKPPSCSSPTSSRCHHSTTACCRECSRSATGYAPATAAPPKPGPTGRLKTVSPNRPQLSGPGRAEAVVGVESRSVGWGGGRVGGTGAGDRDADWRPRPARSRLSIRVRDQYRSSRGRDRDPCSSR